MVTGFWIIVPHAWLLVPDLLFLFPDFSGLVSLPFPLVKCIGSLAFGRYYLQKPFQVQHSETLLSQGFFLVEKLAISGDPNWLVSQVGGADPWGDG